MSMETATLLAAIIAAVVAILNLLNNRSAENRASFRTLLLPVITDLGEATHSVVALSNIMTKTNSDNEFAKWYQMARESQAKLKNVRTRSQYPLWGLDEGIRVLARIPDWTSHARANPDQIQQLLKWANRLKYWIDYIAIRCYRDGRIPYWIEIWFVRLLAARCRRSFDSHADSSD